MFKSPEFILRAITTHWKVRHEFYKDLSGCCVVRIRRGEEQDSKKMVVARMWMVAAGREEMD